MDVNGKKVIVFGGTSGIGKATVERLVAGFGDEAFEVARLGAVERRGEADALVPEGVASQPIQAVYKEGFLAKLYLHMTFLVSAKNKLNNG